MIPVEFIQFFCSHITVVLYDLNHLYYVRIIMSVISKYLTHRVTIVKVTLARGERSEIEIPDIAAFVASKRTVIRDVSGDHFVDKTLIFMDPDANVTEKDEIKVYNVASPIAEIKAPKSTRSSTVSHLEVLLE